MRNMRQNKKGQNRMVAIKQFIFNLIFLDLCDPDNAIGYAKFCIYTDKMAE